MVKNKQIQVILSEEADEQIMKLNEIVGEEIKRGIKKSENQILLKSSKRAIDILKSNPFAGTHVKKSLMPEKYIKNYDASNLWKFDLSNFWRMIYTVKGNDIEIISFILDIVDHNTYNKIFGYRKK
ncbi:MAG: hypothetical protein COY38_00505 [Candidatus Aenigmarchaeota archaeon CG_4_10_14_0_8_um_filter_37_24]|nr:hypothetical protein [Candidatus Aenigmarchaeota archaeon]PIV68373.1 MAG: hypothetical protein COS07_04245 [Candidatus Aenigmarchaeota archaeon CG01_land_8_20_14_3_00_37_9]PIW40932.1 MAG: hypothetical protein COW21_04665 [Candidatus Aenigmarchaeota archaeon CG15_BIG_FIL_POST_REV_8_21_14_020_37_27]PIX50296.1 MAG: hypothetical protein COZ52_04710 [Candidatus Aenigmarchaeota archaeon CG_4_8_14_3_um_filter_37_24]PIY35050.1 MAG: hypothetical protein COZ04_04680 [Candidatus Aenigmarchaeota archaeo